MIRLSPARVPKPSALEHLSCSASHDGNISRCPASEEQGAEALEEFGAGRAA